MSFIKAFSSLVQNSPGFRADKSYFNYHGGLVLAILFCCLVGLVRLYFSVWLNIKIHPKWYALDPDIIFSMLFFSVHLLFVGTMVVDLMVRVFTDRRDAYSRLFSLFFYFQVFHLVVPIIDKLGLKFGLPFAFPLWLPYELNSWYTNGLVMTLGIITVWLVTFLLSLSVLHRDLHLKPRVIAGILLLTWLFMVIPIYLVWPTFNTVTNWLFGLPNGHYNAYWGYGLYFLLTSIVGIWYFLMRYESQVGTSLYWGGFRARVGSFVLLVAAFALITSVHLQSQSVQEDDEFTFLNGEEKSWVFFFGIMENTTERFYVSALFHREDYSFIKLTNLVNGETHLVQGPFTRRKWFGEHYFSDVNGSFELNVENERRLLSVRGEQQPFQLQLAAVSEGVPHWWNDRVVPDEEATDFLNFYGADDVVRVMAALSIDGQFYNLEGKGIFELMYFRNELPEWSAEHHWLNLVTDEHIAYILIFDEFRRAILCNRRSALCQSADSFDVGFPDGEDDNLPREIEVNITAGESSLLVRSSQRFHHSRDFAGFERGGKEIMELFFHINEGYFEENGARRTIESGTIQSEILALPEHEQSK